MRSFESAARLGRQNTAADELLVTHGAISRQIRNLEEYLGVELFTGANRTPELTPIGKRLLRELTPAFDQIDDAVRQVLKEKEDTLDVCCYSTFAMLWLIPRLNKFQKKHPDIEVHLTTISDDSSPEWDSFELAIRLANAETELTTNETVLMKEKLGFVVAPSFIDSGLEVGHEFLARIPRIEANTRSDAWTDWLRIMDISPTVMENVRTSRFAHYSLAIEAVTNGLGGCVTPHHLISDRLSEGKLIAPFGFVDSGRTYIIKSSEAQNRRTTLFRNWLQNELQS
nr:LysR substrate-binding domain-containing protein [Cochlodiniinecator piscidefendens]